MLRTKQRTKKSKAEALHDVVNDYIDSGQPWPADRRSIDAGTLVIDHTTPQESGPCRDINYDPTVLPDGIEISDDPLLPARSAAYAASYLRRTSEEAHLPGTAQTPTKPAPEATP